MATRVSQAGTPFWVFRATTLPVDRPATARLLVTIGPLVPRRVNTAGVLSYNQRWSPVEASRPITRSSWVCTTTISPLVAGAESTSLVTRARHFSSPVLESSATTSPLRVPISTMP
ncbi:hypothetical protein PFLmoz3_05482 [Pseudomonas fluorescens]|uniref:Uncharacterized protein n=1 Tax=Pseudomonas fluorescens TaxID=294 RepID=A0A109LC90_PSEFL|nr:hypothetical protein PFLmoz3_05482 [Pseudomonas fluorescens]